MVESRTILNVKNCVVSYSVSFLISCIALIYVWIFIPEYMGWTLINFVVVSGAVLFFNLLSVIEVIRGRMKVSNPLCLFSIWNIMMFNMTLIGFCISPLYILQRLNFGSSLFPNGIAGVSVKFLYLTYGEIVALLYIVIVLIINNKYRVEDLKYVFQSRDIKVLKILTVLLLMLAVVSFYVVYHFDYINIILYKLGSLDNKSIEIGSARWYMFMKMYSYFVSLALLAYFWNMKNSFKKKLFIGILLIFGIMIQLPSGGRVDLLALILLYTFQLLSFGIKVKKKTIKILMFVFIVLMLFVTVFRTLPEIKGNGNFFSSRTVQTVMIERVQNISGTFVSVDRTQNIAMLIYMLNENNYFLHGRTVAEGIIYPVHNYLALLLPMKKIDSRRANYYTAMWRFGTTRNISELPVSLPGEFYFQFGVYSVIVFSIIFGFLLKSMRELESKSKQLIFRWSVYTSLILVILYSSSDILEIVGKIVVYIFSIYILFWLVKLFVRGKNEN